MMTLEEAQNKILELGEKCKTLETANTTLTEDAKTKDKRITDLQEHNQKLFLKLTTDKKEADKDTEENEQSLEDFAIALFKGEIKE